MKYPSEILPSIDRKHIDCDISEYFLIRSTSTKIKSELVNEETGEVVQSAICSPREHIIDLSTSLWGIFNLQHNEVDLTREGKAIYAHYCEPDLSVQPPNYEEHFIFNDTKGCLVVLINSISNYSVEYYFGDSPEIKRTAICKVIHTPTKWNFWHYSIRWYLPEHQNYLDELKDDKLRNKIIKRLSGEARAVLARNFAISVPESTEIKDSCYMKNTQDPVMRNEPII
jgi:hypothetical protein